MIDKIQKEIDGFAYPPTLTYDYKTMTPTGVLAQRVNLIETNFPNFFQGKKFLDVGSSKGFFSLNYAKNFDKVVGIDIDSKGINICNQIKKENTEFYHTSFGNFKTKEKFDKIFIGNGPHHLYTEMKGYGWIEKVASMSEGEVLLETAIGMECCDMPNVIPLELQSEFNNKRFIEELEKYFEIKLKIPTVNYTPDRYLILLKRK